MKDLGDLKYFLGIEFARSKHGILMHQRKYSLELIAETGLSGAKPSATYVDTNTKQTIKEFGDYIKSTESSVVNDSLADQGKYQRLIGKLLYFTTTRPDISFAVQTLSQYLQQPKHYHMEAAMRVVRYIKNNPGQGVLLSGKSNTDITTYYDADWAACPHPRKSVSGYFVKLGDSLVSWKSKKQNTVSRSSAESEYRSMATTVTELVWILG
ncbi:secreted RxLR effector protein 161-like [Capsicum annuum]|uniref:secreted RxLR effector protein 161-like n=1 Tax=Capsicum annuum TaxID=4072 RepID=UPI0007BF8C78|nr:secreted RxLR effector protein 161-like [Capsicum annuum]